MNSKPMGADGQDTAVPRRIAAAILSSLKGGVVPRIGLPYVTVGREVEVQAFLTDLDLIAAGGASFRFLVGRFGAGKSFLLQTVRNRATGENFVVADCDLSPERRLQGGQGQGLATYRELIKNLSTKTRPEGQALRLVLDRWVKASLAARAADPAGPDPDAALFHELEDMVHGFDFTYILRAYRDAAAAGDDLAQGACLRWLRGEYRLKSEARADLRTGTIIGDDDWYDYVKLLARFLTGAGYQGLIVLIDELVNLYNIPNATARQNNYEKILQMYNDTLQGKAHHLGIIMGSTPQAIEDRRRGIFSYEALRSRLTQGTYAREGMRDMLAPIINLQPLTYEEFMVLIEKLQRIHSGYHGCPERLTQADLVRFLTDQLSRVGADSHVTPRDVTRRFIELLDIVSQNPDKTVAQIMDEVLGARASAPTAGEVGTGVGAAVAPATAPRDPALFAEFQL